MARLVESSNLDKPGLSQSYLEDIFESSGEHIEYWDDALCCAADAKMKLECDPEGEEFVHQMLERGRKKWGNLVRQERKDNRSYINDIYLDLEEEKNGTIFGENEETYVKSSAHIVQNLCTRNGIFIYIDPVYTRVSFLFLEQNQNPLKWHGEADAIHVLLDISHTSTNKSFNIDAKNFLIFWSRNG